MEPRNQTHYIYGHMVRVVPDEFPGLWIGVVGWNAVNGNTSMNPDYSETRTDSQRTPELAISEAHRLIERKRHEATCPSCAGTERNRRIERERVRRLAERRSQR